MADPNIGERVAATYERVYPKKPTDNIFQSCAIFYALGEDGFKEGASGGRLFESPVEYAENSTQQMVSEFSELDLTRIPVFDAARYDQKIAAGTVVYSYLEMKQNQGSDEAKFDLIAARIENGRKSHIALLNRQAWNTAPPGSLDITSIPTFISTTPAVGVVGGINGATFTWWRNRQNLGTKSVNPGDNLINALELTWDQCSLGGIKMTPTAMVSDLASFVIYQSVLGQRLRYMVQDLGKKGDAAFLNSAVMFKATPYFYDEDAPAGNCYMLNNEVLKMQYLNGAWCQLDPAVDPANQLMNVHKLYTFCNFTASARRHLGVVNVIS
jgi:hypothetical protein